MKRFILFASMMLLFCGTLLHAETPAPGAHDPEAVVSAQTSAPIEQTVSNQTITPAENAEVGTSLPAEETNTSEPPVAKNRFTKTFWGLVPPVLAIFLALITKEVYSSLFIGILLGGCLAGDFNFLKTFDAVVDKGMIEAVKGSAGIFIFLVLLGCFASLINLTGATAAFGRWAKDHIKTRVGTMLATFLLGVLIFIDDYFNCLTVGNIMQPLTDAKRISRAKLAYLIDATAAPICMIAPISSWAAAVSQYASGTEYSGLELFIRSIPYNFYSLLTLFFIVAITLLKVDFGPMAIHEYNAIAKNDLYTTGSEVENGLQTTCNPKGMIRDMIVPVILLIVVSIYALLYSGGIHDGKNIVQAFSDTDASVALPWGGLIALIGSIIYLVCRKVITFKEAMANIPVGFNIMVPAILILVLATSLKNMTALLEADKFIAQVMGNSAESLNVFLPAVIFLVAALLAFSTGTAWGTFGILIPIVVNIFPSTSQLLFIGISACLAGAVCGDHCSPISDTTIMSSAGARCKHMNHVSTQLPYAFTVAMISFVGFILAGLIQNWYVVFPITLVLMLALLIFYKIFGAKKMQEPITEEKAE